MSKPWSRTLRVDFEIYSGVHIDFIVCNKIELSWDQIKKHYEEKDASSIENFDGTPCFTAVSRRNEFGHRYIVVDVDADIEIISHECFHSISQLTSDMGVDYKVNGANEAFAYPLGYLIKKCYEYFLKCQKEYAKKRVKNV